MQGKLQAKKRLFFRLCRELHIDVDRARERARKKFNLTSFADIREYQLDQLNDLLLIQEEKRDL